MIAISRLHHPVVALGPGRRAGIWLQGCTIGCAGCVSRDTWTSGPEHEMSVASVMAWLEALGHDEVEGITISGGEPFEQPRALAELLDHIIEWRANAVRAIDVLVFSGYSMKRLRVDHGNLLSRIDAVVAGPFVESMPTDLIWRGSSNQTIEPLTPLGVERYGPYLDERPGRPVMQVASADGAIWWIGIPRRGDMERMRTAMERRGVRFEEVSW